MLTPHRLLLLIFALALIAPLAAAQDAPAPLSELDDAAVLRALASEEYAAREAMTRQLLQDQSVTTDRLRALFAGVTLPEQRHRLLAVAEHIALREMADRLTERLAEGVAVPGPGAIGVSHRAMPAQVLPGLDRPAVQVSYTLPGFPAHAFLRQGDLILAVDGEPLTEHTTTTHFADLVQTRAAGQEIALQIHRDGQRLDVRFRLAHRVALDEIYHDATPRGPYAVQWQALHEQLLRDAPGPVVLRVRPSDDAAAAR